MTETKLNFNHKLMSQLAWAGLIPLGIALVSSWKPNPFDLAPFIFMTMSAVLLAFVVGAQWGQLLFTATDEVELRPAIFVTLLVTMAAWTGLFLGEPLMSTIALLVGYILSYAVESRFLAGAQPAWYRRIRLYSTTAVAVMHALLILRLTT